jgi:hypothetical protein
VELDRLGHRLAEHVDLPGVSGETEANVSGWTVDTVAAHFGTLLDEADRRYEQRFIGQEKAVAAALAAVEKGGNAALVSAKEAVTKAELASEKRFDAVNEFRQLVNDVLSGAMPRAEAEQRIAGNAEKIAAIEVRFAENLARVHSRLDNRDGLVAGSEKQGQRAQATWGTVFAAISVVFGLIGVIGILVGILVALRP